MAAPMLARWGMIFLAGALIALLACLLVVLIGMSFAWATLRTVSRRLEDPQLARRLRSEGPTTAVLEVLRSQGTHVRLLQHALKGYRAAALGLAWLSAVALATLSGTFVVLLVVLARGVSWIMLGLLAAAAPMVLLWGIAVMRLLTKFAAIYRRTARFPAGLPYAQQAFVNWPRTPPPYEDVLADRLQALSGQLDRRFDALYPVAVGLGLIVGIIVMGERAGVFHIR